MSSKQPKEDRIPHSGQLVPRCLVLVLKTKKDRRCKGGEEAGWGSPGSPGPPGPQPGDTPTGGKAIFESFQTENGGCFWNPHLEESIKNLKYVGLLHPNTVLVSGRDIYLDTVKNAYARKVLRPPTGFSLHKVGEVDAVPMLAVQQTQFTPLPEALCVVIHELNAELLAATLDTVQERLADRYRGMQPPPEEIVYETLGSLMKERKIYHTGSAGTGYFIVTPDTYKNGCFNQAHLGGPQSQPLPTVYIPLLTPAATEMRSISCQTAVEEEEKKPEERKKGKLERSQSLKAGKGEKGKGEKGGKGESLGRTASLRYGEDKGKQVIKDINLRTSEAHQDKDKGEKTSLFNKIFGRGKSRRSVAVEEDPLEEEPPEEPEYATFSAQFPPPEWAWYETQQVTSPLRATSPLQLTSLPRMSRAHTWHHMQGVPHFDAGTQSEYDEEDYMKPTASNGYHHPDPHHPHQPDHHPHHHAPHLQAALQVPRHRSSSSHESHSSSHDVTPSPRAARRHERDVTASHHRHQRHSSHRTSSKPRHSSSRHTPPVMTSSMTSPQAVQNEYVQYEDDRHIYCEPSNPVEMYERNVQYEDAPLSMGTGLHDRLAPPELRSQSLPSKTVNSNQALNNNGHRPDLSGSNKRQPVSPRQRGQSRSSRYRELQCASFCGNDISIEYKGRMPKKNSMFSLSRDSGVNCVGVKDPATNGVSSSQGQKDKKLAMLNNQTGASSSRVTSPSGGVNLNNHNQVSPETPHHQTQVHAMLPDFSHSHQDSGFSSPRTDKDHINYKYTSTVDIPAPALPLNNISVDTTGNNNKRALSRSTSRDNGRNKSPAAALIAKQAQRDSQGKEQLATARGEQHQPGKENRGRGPHPNCKSFESLHITSSEKYPSYGELHISEDKDTASSSRSGSSKTTVVEQLPGDGSRSRGKDSYINSVLNTTGTSSKSGSDATYMEIQLNTSDCPVHGEPSREPAKEPVRSSHRDRGVKDSEGVNKRHSLGSKTRDRYHWNQPGGSNRHTGGQHHHYGNLPNNNNNPDKDNSRLAFLGDCEVVGIL